MLTVLIERFDNGNLRRWSFEHCSHFSQEVMDPTTEPYVINHGDLPCELVQASGMWPFTPAYLSKKEHIVQLVSQLPSYERVTALLEAYYSNLAWFVVC